MGIRKAIQHVLILSAVSFTAGGCGGSSGDGPPTPGGPSPTPTAVALTPTTDLLKIGATERFSAQVRMSDGSTRPAVGAVWGSDAPAVAAVDGGGTVSGASAGRATIFADAEGFRGTQLLRVVPDYQGSWAGLYRIAQCTDSGDLRGLCREFFDDFETASILLRLTQNRDMVSGTVGLGELLGDATGTIQMGGDLQLSGSVPFEGDGVKGSIRLAEWSSSVQGQQLSGSFKQVWTAQGAAGDVTLSCVLNGVGRTSSSAAPAPSASGAGGQSMRPLVSKFRKRVR